MYSASSFRITPCGYPVAHSPLPRSQQNLCIWLGSLVHHVPHAGQVAWKGHMSSSSGTSPLHFPILHWVAWLGQLSSRMCTFSGQVGLNEEVLQPGHGVRQRQVCGQAGSTFCILVEQLQPLHAHTSYLRPHHSTRCAMTTAARNVSCRSPAQSSIHPSSSSWPPQLHILTESMI